MMYQCLNCKKRFEIKDKVQCPSCGFRIAKKIRPNIVKRVDAK